MREYFEQRRTTGTITLTLKYKDHKKKWVQSKERLCLNILSIVSAFSSKNYTLTLRQLYYQLVGRDLIPNHVDVYNKLGKVVDDLRYSGTLDWGAMEDRGRVPYLPYSVGGISEALRDTVDLYKRDRQEGQNTVVEVWTEKDAISGILKRVTSRYHVRLVVNKGYSSSTAMYRAYCRFSKYIDQGKKVKVLYFGDHDPSGLDMIRDIDDRIKLFLAKGKQFSPTYSRDFNENFYDFEVQGSPELMDAVNKLIDSDNYTDHQVHKAVDLYNYEKTRYYIEENDLFSITPIGLTMDQIKQYDLPPNPAKTTDPRAKWYFEQYGDESWEVDALAPEVIESIVDEHIRSSIDLDMYKSILNLEAEEKESIRKLADDFNG